MKPRVFGVPLQDRVRCVEDQLQSSDVEGEAVTQTTYTSTISIMTGYNCLNEDNLPSFRFMVDIISLKFVLLLYIYTRLTQEAAHLLINGHVT